MSEPSEVNSSRYFSAAQSFERGGSANVLSATKATGGTSAAATYGSRVAGAPLAMVAVTRIELVTRGL